MDPYIDPQIKVSGNVKPSGNISIALSLGGSPVYGPLTYAARTDSCVLGFASDPVNCINGATTGESGSALVFRNQDADPLPFSALAAANTFWTDPDFGTYEGWATDYNTLVTAGTSGTVSMSNAEGGPFWSTDDSLFLANTDGGAVFLMYVNVARIHAKTCSTVNPCVTYTGIRTLSSAGGHTSTAFAHSAVLAFTRVPTDLPNTVYEDDYDVVYKGVLNGLPGCIASSSCTITWTTYADFTSASGVLPSSYNSPSQWTGGFSLARDGSITLAIGGAGDWTSLTAYTYPDSFIYPSVNNSGQSAFQATSSGASGMTEPNWAVNCPSVGNTCNDGSVVWTNIGGIGGQGPAFDFVNYQPAYGFSRWNTRIGKIYRGSGNPLPAGTIVSDSPSTYYNLNGTVCANNGVSCNSTFSLPDTFTIHDGGSVPDSTYAGVTPTGAGANVSGSFAASCRNQSGSTPQYCYNLYWQIDTLLVRTCNSWTNGVNGQCGSHIIQGWNTFFKGPAFYAHNPSAPQTSTGAPNPGTQLFAVAPAWDQHGAYDSVNPTTTNPAMMAMTDVPSVGRVSGTGYTLSGYNEEIETNTTGSQTQYRMGHNWNTGSAPDFNVQNAFGSISPDGTFYMLATDGMGTRGSNASAGAACNDLRGDTKWAATTSFSSGTRVYPVTNNTAADIFNSSGGTSGSSQPNWGASCASTCTDGSITWTNLGANNCRGDLIVMDLLSAHPAP